MSIQPITKENLKRPLSYIIRNRKGYQSELKQYSDFINHFKQFGFIKTGHNLKSKTYSVTDLADDYYIGVYGYSSYYLQRFRGWINKIFKEK